MHHTLTHMHVLLPQMHFILGALTADQDQFGAGAFINKFVSVLTGPIAMFMAIVAIIAGAAMFIGGREGHEGLKNLGMIGIAIGLLAAMPRIWASFHPANTTGLGF